MSTGDKKSNIYLKKFLPQQQMTDNFLEYLAKRDEDNLKLQYPNQGYFFGNSMAGSGVNEITAATPSLATDGQGHLMKLDPSQAAAKFENALGDTYYVGMRYNVREKDTELNVRTGQIEYTFLEDAIGEKGEPDAVIDQGSTIRVRVNGIFEAGVSHAGRQVIVYLKRAVGQADAFYTGTVIWDGGFNVVDTTHLIGQTAGLVSTDPTDYWVFAPGLTIRKTDIRIDPNYVFLGTVVGEGAGQTPDAGDIDNTEAVVLYGGTAFSTIVNNMRSFLVGGGLVSWDLTNEELTIGADLRLKQASIPFDYQVVADTFGPIADGECGYINVDGLGGIKAVVIAALEDVPDDPKFLPLFYRYGNDILFWQGSLELKGDATTPTEGRINDITQDLLTYLGAANESDSDPDYKNATGSAKENIHLADGDNLTKSIKKLELRSDVVTKVRAVAFLESALVGTGGAPAPVIDGQTLVNGDDVLYMDSVLNGVYRVSGIGTAVVWTKLPVFSGGLVPVAMSLIGVKDSSDEFMRTVFQYTPVRGWRPLNTDEIESEPTGFVKRTDSGISFNNGTRTFTVQPLAPATYFYYVQKGKLYKVAAAKTVVIPNTEGLHFIYFDGVTLVSSQVFDLDIIVAKTFVATVHWDVANQVAIMLSDERHLVTMDGATHAYLHNTNGTQYATGLGISGSVVGDGSADAHAQVSMDGGRIYDEDIIIDIVDDPTPTPPFQQILSAIAQIPVFYRSGANGDWKKLAANNFPLKPGAARPQWNELQGGPLWAAVDASANGKHIAMFILATNDINNPIIAIMGQREDNNLTDAQNNNNIESLDLTGLPTLEFKALFRIIYETNSAYANSINAKQVEFTDLRFAEQLGGMGITPTDHNALSGRTASGAHPSQSISTTVADFGGAGSALDLNSKLMLKTLDDHFKQLRLKEHPTNKNRVILTGATVTLNTGTKLEQQIRNLILKFDGAEIDFVSGIVYEADGLTPLGDPFTPIVPGVGLFRWFSITLLPSTTNANNTINGQLIVIPGASDGASAALAARAPFTSGTKIGQVVVQEDTGSIADILQAAITQQGTGGGSGDGSGDANSFEQDVKDRLRDGFLSKATAVIFERDQDDFEDPSTTAEFDIANNVYKFDVIGKLFESIQLLNSVFLGADNDSKQVEVWTEWLDGFIDSLHTVALSQNGGTTYQNLPMVRVGESNLFRGLGVLAVPPSALLHNYALANASTTSILNATTNQYRAIKFTVGAGIKRRILDGHLYVAKNGSPLGDLYAEIYPDAAGSPDLTSVKASKYIVKISDLLAGNNDVAFTIGAILPAGDYWLVIRPSSGYRDEFTLSAGVNNIASRSDNTAPTYGTDTKKYNGTVWAADTGFQDVFILNGYDYDLRVKITSGTNDVSLKSFAAFYNEELPLVSSDLVQYEYKEFDGGVDTYEFTLIKFLPDPIRLKVYDINTGQVYRYPAFATDGHKVVFAPGTFLFPSETIKLMFDQSDGSGYDNADENAALMVANHLGSTDPSIDRSTAGRGILLKRPDGTMREITLDNSDNIVILSVP